MSSTAGRVTRASILFVCLVVIAMWVSVPVRVYQGAVRLLGTSIGVGPSFDGFGLSIPLMFNGTVIPAGDTFHTVPYPAQINLDYPIISDLPGLSDLPYWPHSLKQSERIGAGYLEQDLAAAPAGAKVTVIGYSQGSQVAEIARADMAKNPAYTANADDYEFVLVGDPYLPNGGILSRFTSWSAVPVIGDLFPLGRPGPSDSPFRTTYYQNQYDGLTDFPAYLGLLSLTNALVGIVFEHILPGYVFDDPDAPGTVSTTAGNTTYVTIPHLLPLLAPLRLAASLVGAQRFVDALDPILRVFVEMDYDRTADPRQVKEFGWSTPPAKVREAFEALPGAFAQSLSILCGATYTPTVPKPVVSDVEPETPVTEHPATPVDNSPGEQAVRDTVVGVSDVLSVATQSVASVLRSVTGHEPAQADPGADADAAVPAATARTASADTPADADATDADVTDESTGDADVPAERSESLADTSDPAPAESDEAVHREVPAAAEDSASEDADPDRESEHGNPTGTGSDDPGATRPAPAAA